MQVKCSKCRQDQEIATPTAEGWQYEFDNVKYRFNDDGSQSVESRSGKRRVFWKCAGKVPTEDNPNALCGADNQVVEDWSEAPSGASPTSSSGGKDKTKTGGVV